MTVNSSIGSNIIPMDFKGAAMKYPAISQVEAYWTALSNGGTVPLRADIDPRGLEDVLEYAFILERIAPGVGRFRLAGGHLVDLMGMEVRGMPVTAIFVPEARKSLSDVIEQVCDRPQVAELTLDSSGGIGREPLAARMFLAPLRSDFGKVDRLLGCLQAEGRIGRQPRRFTVTDKKITSIGTDHAYPEAPAKPLIHSEFAEPLQAFDYRPGPKKPGDCRPALRLVMNDD